MLIADFNLKLPTLPSPDMVMGWLKRLNGDSKTCVDSKPRLVNKPLPSLHSMPFKS